MSIETVTLAIMRERRGFEELFPLIDVSTIDPKQAKLIAGFEKYFERHPSHEEIDYELFVPWFYKLAAGSIDDAERAVYGAIISASMRTVDNDSRLSVREDIHQINFATKTGNLLAAFEAGEAPSFAADMSQNVDAYNTALEISTDAYVPMDFDKMVNEEKDQTGLKWRISEINKAMRPLRPGDFGIIGGRPDQGKTSLIASELTYFATQFEPDEIMVWINNEGGCDKINNRLVQSALGKTTKEIAVMGPKAVREAYVQAVGRLDRIQVMDCNGWNNWQVERLIAKKKPRLVVFDMIDNIHGFGDSARTDLALEKMYQWAREKAAKHGTISIGTSQISNEGAAMPFPGLGMLKDSKTGKQGASDWQMMIGSLEVPGDQTRWLSLVKNKLRVAGSIDLKQDCIFDRDIGRYRAITFIEDAVEHDPSNP